jgi:hypothetical protein
MPPFIALATFRLQRTILQRFALPGLAILALLISSTACTLSPSMKETPAHSTTITPTAPTATTPPKPAYTLTIENPGNLISSTIVNQLQAVFDYSYPKIVHRFGSSSTVSSVPLIVYSSNDGSIAYTEADQVHINAIYQNAHTNDLGWLTHELTHVVQHYVGDNIPGWFTEGMADFSRYYYAPPGANPPDWVLRPPTASDKYTDGYGTTARFLIWLQQHTSSTIVDMLNHTLQTQPAQFTTMFQQITNGTVDQLWTRYITNPTIDQP